MSQTPAATISPGMVACRTDTGNSYIGRTDQ